MEKQQMTGKVKREIWRQRIGYGFADFACNLIWQMISLYLLYFYTDVMDLNEVSIALMFVVCRVIDAGTDLLIGYCIDKTHTKWGKSRPYFLFGAAPFAIFAVLAFSVPDILPTGKLVYAYVTYIGLSFMYTVVNIPMASILPSLTASTEERTALSTSRKLFGFLGASVVSAAAVQLAGLLVIWAAGMNHMVILAGAVVTAFGYGVKESIYFSMQADPVDYGEWKTGINTAGSLSAINGFLGKVAQAAAGGIGGLLLAWGGYEGSAAVQSANAVTAICAMYLYIPMILLVCSIVIMMFYNLDKIYPQIKRELEQRQQNKE